MTTSETQAYIAANTFDPQIAVPQAYEESRFKERAFNQGSQAAGVFQFIPSTWGQYGGGGDVYDVPTATAARNSYMEYLLNLFGWDYAKALAGYNWGEGRVQKAVAAYGSDWLSHAPAETQGYVSRILGAAGSYQPPVSDDLPDDPAAEGVPWLALGIGALLLAWAVWKR